MSLPDLAIGQGRRWGWEFATLSFPLLALGAVQGCQLPDAILHG